jgi:hypothetical protein
MTSFRIKANSVLRLLIISTLFACQKSNLPVVESFNESVQLGDGTRIKHSYPQCEGINDTVFQAKLNLLLHNISDFQYLIANNQPSSNKIKDNDGIIHIGYRTTIKNDSLLGFEFYKNFEKSDSLISKDYRAILVNHRNGLFYSEPSEIIASFKRSKILSFIQNADTNKSKFFYNEYSYDDSKNTLLTWTITNDSLLIYPGGEGEAFGYFRVSIPLSFEPFNK